MANIIRIGTDRTLERGPVDVYQDLDNPRMVYVADVGASLDLCTGLPMGLRYAPIGTSMAAQGIGGPDYWSPDFKREVEA